MKSIVLIARLLLSLLGVALVVLGIFFWTGHALSLLPLHAMVLGGLFVICLWVLVIAGLLTPHTRAFALGVLVWSLIVPALGASQLSLLPGSYHWVVQVTHLVVGMIAVGLGQRLARRIAQRPAEAAVIPQSA